MRKIAERQVGKPPTTQSHNFKYQTTFIVNFSFFFLNLFFRWLPKETDDSREDYLRALAQSDLTLSPVGVNTECYRIYEALSYGSLPVIEDRMTPGNCGPSVASKNIPLRLLKEAKAPLLFVKDWSELPAILEKEAAMSQKQKANRRRHFIQWYEDFKSKMRDILVRTLQEKFFHIVR